MLRKNVAGQFVHIAGINVSTGAIVTGATWTMRRCLDGTFAAGGATITEDSTNGFYKVALTQADTNGNDIGYFFTATNCVPQLINVVATAADPTDSVRFGLTALPNAAAGANTGLPVVGTQVPNATAGAANGLLIAGSNAATTFAGLTTGALACTTIIASGAVAFQSTFAVTTSTSLGAISGTTLTLSGAVAFQSTFAVTGTTTLAAVNTGAIGTGNVTITGTLSTSGTVTLNALTVTNNCLVSGTTTLTGAVSLGSTLAVTGTTTLAALNTGTFTPGAASDFTTTQKTSLNAATPTITVGSFGSAQLDSTNFTAAAENAFADALLDRANAIETGITLRLNERYTGSALAGVLSGAATTTVTILGINVATVRITATVDANGNRSAVVLS